MARRRQGSGSAGAADTVLTSIEGGASHSVRAARTTQNAPTAAIPPSTSADEDGGRSRLWHVVLSVAGRATPLTELKRGLEQLAHDHTPFLTARYATDHGEIRYWEQAEDLQDAAAMALRLWGEHKASARLPPWEIVGLEVVDRATYHKRIAEGYGESRVFLGGVHPY
ncbi:hypothetical protein ACEZCY_24140 [Streptacidiphilus sp. N1-12]|uniref:Uncharacterized protein n=2 Tax=Streptacidiphilus alkalitolerans TaxID=3342712 RepID=A0ABV6WU03_9ACTN